jgi:uncharacterized protein (TIGR02118 family)
MHKLVILLEKSGSDPLFMDHWPSFLHLAEKMPGLRREVSSHVENLLVGDFPYTLIHELHFDTPEATRAAMASPQGKQAGALLQNMTQGRVVLFFADHSEDSIENLSRYERQQ